MSNNNFDNNSSGEAEASNSFDNSNRNNDSILLELAPDNTQLYIEKLGLLYQSLEGRVQRLETILSENCLNITNCSNSANCSQTYPLLAERSENSNSIGGSSAYNVNDYSMAVAGSGPVTLNSSSSSSLASFLEPNQREISVRKHLIVFISYKMNVNFRNLIWMIFVCQHCKEGQLRQLGN